ncbi:MAG: DHH family phosphoesterase, partial [Oscillospiraceae bacterium]|nr:DHH family phosphoesterase [Oscillospiraceae bacterium]
MYFVFLVIFVLAALFTGQFILAAAEAVVVALLAWYSGYSNKKRKRQVIEYIEAAAYNLEGASKGMLRDMPFPMVIFNINNGRILWNNESFLNITGGRDHFFEIGIGEMVPGFKYRWLTEGKHSAPEYVRIGERIYNVYGNAVKMDERNGSRVYWGVLYWLDVTDYVVMERKYKDTRPVVAVMMLDNYDELFKSVTETAKSAVLAAVDSLVMEWSKGAGGYLSRYDRDRYIFIFEESYMPGILADKFAILDKVREITGPGGIPATMSIGIGRGAANLEEGFQYALLGIDMALSRGGDQAVIKNNQNFEFYGGHSVAVERRTKVKSRVMATALGELIQDASNIIITGHKHADLDCISSAVGLCCIARKKGKPAYVIIDKDTNVAMPLVKKLKELPEYEHTFISESDAMLIADGKTLLIVVDTNRPDQVEAGDLLISCNRIAVVDHHRRAAEYISNAAL